MKRRGIACAGNWIVDIVHTIDAWPRKSDLVRIKGEAEGTGGGAANVLLALAAFRTGLPLFALGLIGTDRHAETVRAAVTAAKADTSGLKQTDRAPTAHTHVMNLPGDSRTFFYHPGTNDLLGEEDIAVEAAAAKGAAIFYLGYLNLLGTLDEVVAGKTGAARVLARASAAGMVTAVDLVSTDRPEFRDAVEAALPEIDYLFLNEVEAARATGGGTDAADEVSLAAAARKLLAKGVRRAVILHTPVIGLWLGADGTMITRRPDPVLPEDIISPVGAGDAFAAGCLYGLHESWDAESCLRLGHRAAAAALKGATATESIPPLSALL